MSIEDRIRKYEEMAKNVGKYVMFDCIVGTNVRIDALMYWIVKRFVKDRYKTIVDPTCGLSNYQFNNIIDILEAWGLEYKPCDKHPENWACKRGYSNCVCDVFNKITLPQGVVWIYDPPYLPTKSNNKRKQEYFLYGYSLEDIKRYYSRTVFKNFIDRGAKLVIVKGADFYMPPDSDNLYLFIKDILDPPPSLKIIAYIKYRFYSNNTPIANYRLWRLINKHGTTRLHIVTTYYVVMKKV